MNKRQKRWIPYKKKKNTGFTLAELLIVVAIIAVLVAVAIPLFTSQLEKSRKAVCMNERDTMRRAAAIAAMTEDVNWKGMNYAQIFAKLKELNMVNDFECQSGGTITATVNEDGTAVTFTCSVHDGGESGESWKNQTEKAQKNLEKALKEFLKSHTGSNTTILKEFFGKGYKLDKASPKDVLTDEMIEQWIAGLDIQDEAKKAAVKKRLKDYQESELAVVPYVTPTGKIVTYYTANTDRFSSDKQCHSDTNMICIDGVWYANVNMKGGEWTGPQYVAWLKDLKDDDQANKELIKSNGWIPIS